MIGSVGQGDSTPKITLSEFPTSKELMEKELDARVKRKSRSLMRKSDESVWGFTDSSFRSVVNTVLTHFTFSLAPYLMQTAEYNLIQLHFTEDKRADSKQSDNLLVPKRFELFKREGSRGNSTRGGNPARLST